MAEEIVKRVRIVGSAEGMDQASMALDKLTGAYGKLDQASEAASRSVVTQSRSVLSTSTAYERLRLNVDLVANAQAKLERATRTATAELERGNISLQEHAATLDLAARKYGLVQQANDNLAHSSGTNRAAMLELGHVAKASFESIASGAPILTVLAQQGASTAQAIAMTEGGLGGVLRGVGGAAAGLLTPLAAAAGAVVAVGVGSALAYRSFAQGQRTLQDSMAGLGRSSDATVDSVNRMAPAWAQAGKVSTAQARDMAAAFASTGQIGQSTFGDLIGFTERYAKVTGEELPDATKELAQIFADPVRGADELAKRFGGLSDASREVVRRLAAQGDITAAQRALLMAASQGVRDVTAETNAWSASIDAVTRAAKDLYDTTGRKVYRLFDGATPQERAAESEQARRSLQEEAERAKGYPSQGSGSPLLDNPLSRQGSDADRRRLDNATGLAEHDSEVSRRASQGGYATMIAEEAAKASRTARSAIDAMIPTTNDVRQLEEFQTALTQALRVPGEVANEQDARATLDIIAEKLKAGGQAAYELRKATTDAFSVAGLLPYQRELAQIEQRYRDLNQAAGTNAAALATNAEAKAREQATLRQTTIGNSLRDQGFRIDEQVSALQVQRQSFGLSTEAAAALAAKTDLINGFLRQGVTDLSDYTAKIDELAAKSGQAAKAQEDFAKSRDRIVGGMDELRSGTSGLLTGTFSDLRQGKNPLQTIVSGLGRMTDQYFDRMVAKPLTESLLGPLGKPGGGMFGDGVSKTLFGGLGGMSTPSMSVQAAMVTINGGVGASGLPGAGTDQSSVLKWPVGKVDSMPLGPPGAVTQSSLGGGSADVVSYIRQAAAMRGIDPEQALKVARSEGLNVFNPGAKYDTTGGDGGMSFGPWQLYTGGGLGNTALSKGINVRDPSTWRDQTDFALDQAKQGGWGPWHGWKGDPWQGITRGGQGSPMSSLENGADQASAKLSTLSGQAGDASQGLGSFGSGLDQFGAKLSQASLSGGGSGGGGGFGSLFGGFGSGGGSGGFDLGGQLIGDTVWLADGGMVRGPGGPRSDNIPAWLSPGEYVLPAHVVGQHFDAIQAMHYGAPRYADGGPVGMPSAGIPVSMDVPMPANANGAGHGIIIHQAPLNVTPAAGVTPDQLYDAVQRGNAETVQHIQRHFGSMAREHDRRYGTR